MTPAPLAIVQARMGSTRLPGKMLLPFDGYPLVIRAWRTACRALGTENVVVAIPATPENDELAAVLARYHVETFAWHGPENDVLGRFWHCAHTYRWHPDTVILRVTPDDPWKDMLSMRRVLNGERLPVELGGEAFTLAMLDRARTGPAGEWREHLGNNRELFPVPAPRPPEAPHPWTIDTQAEYDACVAYLSHGLWPGKP
jgi:spore coat polysaccharide biosynthesis protein SpsF (cytidylyltransferase family)